MTETFEFAAIVLLLVIVLAFGVLLGGVIVYRWREKRRLRSHFRSKGADRASQRR